MTTQKDSAFLFDLDGTLIDSVYQHVIAWREALEQVDVSLAIWKLHRRIGMSGGVVVTGPRTERGKAPRPRTLRRVSGRDTQGRPPATTRACVHCRVPPRCSPRSRTDEFPGRSRRAARSTPRARPSTCLACRRTLRS